MIARNNLPRPLCSFDLFGQTYIIYFHDVNNSNYICIYVWCCETNLTNNLIFITKNYEIILISRRNIVSISTLKGLFEWQLVLNDECFTMNSSFSRQYFKNIIFLNCLGKKCIYFLLLKRQFNTIFTDNLKIFFRSRCYLKY